MCVINYEAEPYEPLTQKKLEAMIRENWQRVNIAEWVWYTIARDMKEKGTLKRCPNGCFVVWSGGSPAPCNHGNWSF